jgi:hypothetical protein
MKHLTGKTGHTPFSSNAGLHSMKVFPGNAARECKCGLHEAGVLSYISHASDPPD